MTRVYNRLINEQSPYLLQHAHNPVDWYPWSEEAFEKAKNEDKPIFLSIGYSTCHWCHVMEKESFEDDEIAKLMNDAFVCIKVDREERPDLDNIYMNVSQIMTGSGGWPLNVLLTPEGKPFFVATYIPPDSYLNRMGMKDFVPAIVDMWTKKRDDILSSAEEIIKWLNKEISLQGNVELDIDTLDTAFWQLYAEFDQNYGGFGGMPKFPCVNNLLFLLRYWKKTGDERALLIVEKSLKSMRIGGIYDHVGFGFHRYATDAKWLLPHFEKMLYDQAMFIIIYSEAFQATKDPFYSQTVREIIRYVFRHLTDSDGGFYSGEDADSEGEEGRFYLWQEDELEELLDQGEFHFVKNVFNISEEGNYLEESTRKKTGKNILYMEKSVSELAIDYNLSEDAFYKTIGDIRRKLFSRRDQRVPPHKDDKVLTDWNGLMIAALAIASQVLGEHKYLKRAQKAADFIINKMIDNKGKLLHRYRKGEASINAFVDDYSFLIFALIELYEASFESKYLEKAFELMDEQINNFWDDKNGGFFFTSHGSEALIARKKEITEGSVPSGNAISLYNLLRLGRISSDNKYEQMASELIDAFATKIKRYPIAFTQFLSSLDFAFDSVKEIVIAGDPYSPDTKEMISAVRSLYLPNKIVLIRSDDEEDLIQELACFTRYQTSMNNQATAYVCLNYSCKNPTVEIEEMMTLLNK